MTTSAFTNGWITIGELKIFYRHSHLQTHIYLRQGKVFAVTIRPCLTHKFPVFSRIFSISEIIIYIFIDI